MYSSFYLIIYLSIYLSSYIDNQNYHQELRPLLARLLHLRPSRRRLHLQRLRPLTAAPRMTCSSWPATRLQTCSTVRMLLKSVKNRVCEMSVKWDRSLSSRGFDVKRMYLFFIFYQYRDIYSFRRNKTIMRGKIFLITTAVIWYRIDCCILSRLTKQLRWEFI